MTDTRTRPTRCLFVLLCACTTAQAAEPVLLDASRAYLVGASLASSASHVGESEQRLSLRPLWAFQLGRFRLATSRASSLLSAGRDTVDPGLSTVLATTNGWRLSTSLRYDKGRTSGTDALLVGLPDVRDTLRGRASASLDLGPRWSGSVSGSQDLLGRGGGFDLNTGLNYRYPVSQQTYWDLGLGAVWGTNLYRQNHYGISPDAALATGRTPYQLGSGWERVSLGWNMTSALSPRWVAFGGLNLSQLQGAAARSPLVGRQAVYAVTVGLAYRSP
ncbi:MAG: MipA/OmpV family protein [Hydrogenophaga sp.]|uniref:MipA/OmpV family protein n=1 Tax=Hydrogenophaga sp. TaxID=1904254 RepID=UPI00277412E3|nr:MipA/OmpV family protein [Hydrogenophaga sp.]MDP2416072.1 MipA/OmpV family protein [Hydrogenophaga sp.]MDZ4187075.1 MipA/OmpV family protein [Hydrogenophaga sp.]